MRRLYPDIEDLRKQVVDSALIIIAVIVTLSLPGVIRSIIINGFSAMVGLNLLMFFVISALALFRNRISSNLKTILVILFISTIFVLETIYWGLLVASESYIFLILIFFFGFLTYRKAILFTLCYIAVYVLIAYLFITGFLTPLDKYEVPEYMSKILPWLISALHIIITSFAVLIAMHRFSVAYIEKIDSLKSSESRYRSLSETENTGIWHQNNEGGTEFINDAMCRILEIESRQELSGLTYLDFLTDDSREIVARENRKRLKGHSSTYEVVLSCKNGARKNVIVTGSPLFDQDNRVVGSIGTFIDVTGIRKTESALAESEKRYREMSELLPQVVYESDAKGVITYVNKNGQEIFGIYEDEIKKGVTILSTIDPSEHERVKENIGKISAEGHKGGNEYTMVRKDGSRFPALIYSSPIIREGRFNGLRGTIVDISERKKAEEVLKSSERWFRELLDLNPYGVAVNDMSGRYFLVNKKFIEDTGFTIDEIIGKTQSDIGLIPDKAQAENLKKEIESKGFAENQEVGIRTKDGRLLYVIYASRIIKLNDKPFVLSSTIDITDRKKLERELEKHRNHLEELVLERTAAMEAANEELTATNEELFNQREELQKLLNALNEAQQKLIESEKMASVGVLAAGISHEINNPLNFIQGGLYALEDYYRNNLRDHSQGLEPLFQVISEGVNRASEIVSSLNHFSRRTESHNENCDIHKIIDNCLTILKNQVKHKIIISTNYSGEKIVMKGNEGKLHQAILNIILNSVHSFKDHGEIEIKTEMEKNDAIITISDNGCGISPENLTRIFDPFFTTKEPGKGIGLGLSITYNIIKDHSGDISIKSALNKGTTVTIRLPVTT